MAEDPLPKIVICHHSADKGLEWQQITVSANALHPAHGGHDLDVWPPSEGVTDGMNWPKGEPIFANNCVMPVSTPAPTLTPTPSATPSSIPTSLPTETPPVRPTSMPSETSEPTAAPSVGPTETPSLPGVPGSVSPSPPPGYLPRTGVSEAWVLLGILLIVIGLVFWRLPPWK